jgi:tetratricopeptide (TPR) repeat protein
MVDQSLARFEGIVKQKPPTKWTPQAVLALGDIYKKRGRYDKAIPQYEILIQKYPESSITNIANNRIGMILKAQNKDTLAIEYFKVARTGENSELNAQIQFDIAECCEKTGRDEEAIEEYLRVEYKYPIGKFWVARARLKCAALLEKHGEDKRALKMYRKLAEGEGTEADDARKRIELLTRYSR